MRAIDRIVEASAIGFCPLMAAALGVLFVGDAMHGADWLAALGATAVLTGLYVFLTWPVPHGDKGPPLSRRLGRRALDSAVHWHLWDVGEDENTPGR